MDVHPGQYSAVQIAKPATLTESHLDGEILLKANGDWVIATIAGINEQLRKIEAQANVGRKLCLDLKAVDHLDTAGAWLVARLGSIWRQAGGEFRIENTSSRTQKLLNAIDTESTQIPRKEASESIFYRFFYQTGKLVNAIGRDTAMALNVIGAAIRGPQLKSNRKGGIRPISIVHHIDKMGLRAVPIIILMSILLGAIVAQQAAFQLRLFGLEVWASDFSAATLLREIAVLLTAIMIAGRSGSSMTAEIGAMKMREEIDALTVIGLSPIGVLVFPRLVALTIALPLLTFIADMAALVGAALVLRFYSDVPFDDFLIRMRAYIDLETVFAGLIKAPFMGFAIGLMAAVEGMKVEGSTESLGQRTTASVVKGIFLVILIDGFFAIFFAAIDY